MVRLLIVLGSIVSLLVKSNKAVWRESPIAYSQRAAAIAADYPAELSAAQRLNVRK